ncbi:MAG: hypothetical protein RBU37_15285 [Myxococcota bacterium]|jgi:hypothetical protein|nr:hypothetical protein [Myxococcota bacterium]
MLRDQDFDILPTLRVRVRQHIFETAVERPVGETGQAPNHQELGGTGQAPNHQELGGTGQAPNHQEIALVSYCSQGLAALGQREIVFSVDQNSLLPEQFDDPLSFFEMVYHAARTGLYVDVGDLSRFGETPMIRGTELSGVCYLPAQRLPGFELPPNALSALGLFGPDEVAMVESGGLARLLPRLAKDAGLLPYPPLTLLSRPKHCGPDDWSSSLLSTIPGWTFPHARCSLRLASQNGDLAQLPSSTQAPRTIRLRLRREHREQWQAFWPLIQDAPAFALRTGIDWDANAILLWEQQQSQVLSNSHALKPNSTISTAGLVLLRSDLQHSSSLPHTALDGRSAVLEDCLACALDELQFSQLRRSLEEGTELQLGPLQLEWVDV